jgi:hypothetical protein
MSQKLIDLNPDFARLRNEGFAIEIREGFLLVHEVPYVDSARQIKYGILVSDLSSLVGGKTVSPISQHVAFFIGAHPCNADGTVISAIVNASGDNQLTKNLRINHTFSNKPQAGYADYYEKVMTYVTIIASQAQAIDKDVVIRPFKDIGQAGESSVFNYSDYNSSKAKINIITDKLCGQKIAIIGTGGTGSYVLDLVAKTPVDEIHLFDGDIFFQQNAFRTPGAPSLEKLQEVNKKANYLRDIYSNMRKNIIAHDYHIDSSNVDELGIMTFVFLCVDNGAAKKLIIAKLLEHKIPFIDVGIGVIRSEDILLGHVRTTTVTSTKQDHLKTRISFADGAKDDYSTNIQIADLNALNAALAVIKWKKLFGFYHDAAGEFNSLYSINDNKLFNEDFIT